MISITDLTPCDWDKLPDCPCVYVIHDSGEILYVGQTTNMQRRWNGHHRGKQIRATHPDATISLYFTDKADLRDREREFILDLSPCLNGQAIPDKKWAGINLDRDLYDKLTALAGDGYRSVPAEIRYLVDRELASQELAEARRVVAGESETCAEASRE